jgi:L-iditol 2-dehydrogenase
MAPIGQISMQVAYAFGADEVITTDVVSEKLERAVEHGAAHSVDVAEGDLEAEIEEYTDGEGVDVVIEASGAEPAITSTLDVVRRGGTVVLLAMPIEGEISPRYPRHHFERDRYTRLLPVPEHLP